MLGTVLTGANFNDNSDKEDKESSFLKFKIWYIRNWMNYTIVENTWNIFLTQQN